MEIKEPDRVSIVDYLALTNDPRILEVALKNWELEARIIPSAFTFRI